MIHTFNLARVEKLAANTAAASVCHAKEYCAVGIDADCSRKQLFSIHAVERHLNSKISTRAMPVEPFVPATWAV